MHARGGPEGRGRTQLANNRLRWLLVLLLSVVGHAAQASAASGCPHEVDVCCGSNGMEYQNPCLATAQGVRVLHRGPCEDGRSRRRMRSVQLHRVLQAAPPSRSSPGHSRRRKLIQQPHGDWGGGHAAGSEAPRVVTHAEMHAFKREGFTLVGLVQLGDVHPGEQPVPLRSSEEEDGSTQDDMDNIRALRITPSGLLYAATYDLEHLAAAVRTATRKARIPSPEVTPLGFAGELRDACSRQRGPCKPQQPAGRSQGSPRGTSMQGTHGAGSRSKQAAPVAPQDEDDDLIIEVGEGLPHLPYFDPSEHAPAAPQQRLRRRRLSAMTEDEAIAARARETSITLDAASATDATISDLGGNMAVCPSTKFPYTAIGQLQLTDSSGAHVCSGALVGEDAVLTAAHCVFKRDGEGGGTFYRTLDFAAGRWRLGNGTVDPYGITPWAFATIFDTYETVPDQYQFDWDVCIVRLVDPVGSDAGWLGMAAGCAINANTGEPSMTYKVTTAGYPAALPFGTCTYSSCNILRDNCKARKALHTCPSLSGQSGAPFFLGKDNKIRGVLVGTMQDGSGGTAKVAHIVGTGSYSAILKWVAEPANQAMQNDRSSNDTTYVAPSGSGSGASAGKSPSPSKSRGPTTPMDGSVSDSQFDGNNTVNATVPSPPVGSPPPPPPPCSPAPPPPCSPKSSPCSPPPPPPPPRPCSPPPPPPCSPKASPCSPKPSPCPPPPPPPCSPQPSPCSPRASPQPCPPPPPPATPPASSPVDTGTTGSEGSLGGQEGVGSPIGSPMDGSSPPTDASQVVMPAEVEGEGSAADSSSSSAQAEPGPRSLVAAGAGPMPLPQGTAASDADSEGQGTAASDAHSAERGGQHHAGAGTGQGPVGGRKVTPYRGEAKKWKHQKASSGQHR